jgi:hypothetical protein
MLYNSGQIYNPSQNYKFSISCGKIYPWKRQGHLSFNVEMTQMTRDQSFESFEVIWVTGHH